MRDCWLASPSRRIIYVQGRSPPSLSGYEQRLCRSCTTSAAQTELGPYTMLRSLRFLVRARGLVVDVSLGTSVLSCRRRPTNIAVRMRASEV